MVAPDASMADRPVGKGMPKKSDESSGPTPPRRIRAHSLDRPPEAPVIGSLPTPDHLSAIPDLELPPPEPPLSEEVGQGVGSLREREGMTPPNLVASWPWHGAGDRLPRGIRAPVVCTTDDGDLGGFAVRSLPDSGTTLLSILATSEVGSLNAAKLLSGNIGAESPDDLVDGADAMRPRQQSIADSELADDPAQQVEELELDFDLDLS